MLGTTLLGNVIENGSFYSNNDWVGITEDFFVMFRGAGSVVLSEVPEVVRDYMRQRYGVQ